MYPLRSLSLSGGWHERRQWDYVTSAAIELLRDDQLISSDNLSLAYGQEFTAFLHRGADKWSDGANVAPETLKVM